MKLKYDFSFIPVGDEITGVPIGEGAEAFHGILCLNETGKSIMTLLKEDRDLEEIVTYFHQQCPESEPKLIRESVTAFIRQLIEKDLII